MKFSFDRNGSCMVEEFYVVFRVPCLTCMARKQDGFQKARKILWHRFPILLPSLPWSFPVLSEIKTKGHKTAFFPWIWESWFTRR